MPSPSTSISMVVGTSSTSGVDQAPSLCSSPISSRTSSVSTQIPECWPRPDGAAAEEGVNNASWVQMRAEDLPGPLGTFRVISFGQSFHWMDRPRVASTVRRMLDANGAVVQVDLWHTSPPNQELSSGPYPPIPEEAIDELRRRWLGPDRRAGQGFRNTSPDGEDAVFRAAGFAPEELVIVPDDRVLERSVEDVVAWVLSTSSTAPHLFGDRLDEFGEELSCLLLDVSPEGRFSVPLSDNRLRIRRPHSVDLLRH